MRKSAFVPLLACFIALPSSGNSQQIYDTIQLRIPSGYCEMLDTPGMIAITVNHHFTRGALASRFRVEPGPGLTWVYVSETHHFTNTFGNTQSGVEVCYAACVEPLDDPLITIYYLATGTSGSCAELKVMPHPQAETVDVIDCNGAPISAWARGIFVNPSLMCSPCETATMFPGTPHYFSCQPLATSESTWGAIKALYR